LAIFGVGWGEVSAPSTYKTMEEENPVAKGKVGMRHAGGPDLRGESIALFLVAKREEAHWTVSKWREETGRPSKHGIRRSNGWYLSPEEKNAEEGEKVRLSKKRVARFGFEVPYCVSTGA